MMIAGIGIITFLGLGNLWFYEYRVIKTDSKLRVFNFTGYRGNL